MVVLLLSRNNGRPARHHWWQLIRKKTAITPLPPASSQILWTSPSSVDAAFAGKVASDSHLPGTCSSFAQVMQVWPHNLFDVFMVQTPSVLLTQLQHGSRGLLPLPTRSKSLLPALDDSFCCVNSTCIRRYTTVQFFCAPFDLWCQGSHSLITVSLPVEHTQLHI